MTAGDESADHLAMQIRPRWVAVQQKHWVGVTRTFVDEMKSERGAVGSGNRSIVRLEVVVLKTNKSIVGSAQEFHCSALGRHDGVDKIVDEAPKDEDLGIFCIFRSTDQ